jgi:hypothetical protein
MAPRMGDLLARYAVENRNLHDTVRRQQRTIGILAGTEGGMTLPVEPEWLPGPWAVTDDEYYADREHVSNSMLKVFSESPAKYYGRFVSGTLPAPPATKARAFGTAFHEALLRPGEFQDRHAVVPEGIDRRYTAGKLRWAEFERANQGKLYITDEEWCRITAMVYAVRAHDQAAALVERPSVRERAFRWYDRLTGLPCKAKADILLEGIDICVDVKTADDPTPDAWLRDAARYFYHRQAAWYQDGLLAALNSLSEFYHLVVGSEPPHEVVVYRLADEDVEAGRRQNTSLLAELSRCAESGRWRRWEGVQIGRLPRWAHQDV